LLAAAGALVIAAVVVGAVYAFRGSGRPIVAQPNSVAVIDPASNKIVGVVPVGSTPRGVAVGRQAVWVANSADGTVSQIDINKLRVIKTVGIGLQATDVVVANGRAWVATGIDNSVVPIDERSGGVQEAIHLSRDRTASAYALAVGAGALWAASGARLLKIDLGTGTIVSDRRPSCCIGIHDVAVGEGAVWIADTSEEVLRVSPYGNGVTGRGRLGVIPTAVKAGYGAVWLAVPDPNVNRPLGALWRVDPQTVRVTHTISVGKSVSYLASLDLALGAGSLWISNFDAGTLVRVDPKTLTVVATIHIGNNPSGVAVGAGRVWVTVS
jgi:YVTN family beta-propeller protein